MEFNSQCAKCGMANRDRICRNPEGIGPGFCPTKNKKEILEQAKEIYQKEEIMRFAAAAARQEVTSGVKINGGVLETKPRIVETIEFCKRMGYHHIGLVFCGTVHKEAKVVNEILETNGFQVTSGMCKMGGVDKEFLGLTMEEKRNPVPHESMCNPIGQALVMNAAKTEFNIVMGLCVGHDSLFLKHSEAMCTVLASKDRVFAHNPMAAVYMIDSCCKYLKQPLNPEEFTLKKD